METKNKINNILDKGWQEPNTKRQKEAIKKAIDELYKNSKDKTFLLTELKDTIKELQK